MTFPTDPVLNTDTYDDIAALKALSVSSFTTNNTVNVLGYYVAGDGGGGLFRFDPAFDPAAAALDELDDWGTIIKPNSITHPNPGRWLREMGPKHLWAEFFGALPSAPSNTVRTQNMNNALSAARALGCEELNVGSLTLDLDGQLNANDVTLVGRGMRGTKLQLTTSLGAGVPFITQSMTRNGEVPWAMGARRLTVSGPGATSLPSLGEKPPEKTANCDGIKALDPARYESVRVEKFDCGYVAASPSGHCSWINPQVTNNYYGVYLLTANFGDWSFVDGNINGNTFANIAVPGTQQIDRMTMYDLHCGFAPYGVYQEPAAVGTAAAFLVNCSFDYVSFEALGNGLLFTEQWDSTDVDEGVLTATYMNRISHDWFPERYRIAARAKDYAIQFNCGQLHNYFYGNIKNGDQGAIYQNRDGGFYTWDKRENDDPGLKLVWGAAVTDEFKRSWHIIPAGKYQGRAQINKDASEAIVSAGYIGPEEAAKVELTMRSTGGLSGPSIYVSSIASDAGNGATDITVGVSGGTPTSPLLFDWSLT
jgi:hypothetical protein